MLVGGPAQGSAYEAAYSITSRAGRGSPETRCHRDLRVVCPKVSYTDPLKPSRGRVRSVFLGTLDRNEPIVTSSGEAVDNAPEDPHRLVTADTGSEFGEPGGEMPTLVAEPAVVACNDAANPTEAGVDLFSFGQSTKVADEGVESFGGAGCHR
jgi:hypothetical protein